MGHLAKADGRVSRDEIALAEAVMSEMDLSPELRRTAIRLFEQGKSPGFPLDKVLDQFRRECLRRQTLIQMFLEIQLQAAYADGDLDRNEDALLRRICEQLGIPLATYHRLEQMVRAERRFGGGGQGPADATHRGPSLEDAYALLDVSPGSSEAEVKRAYRRLMSQHHPDKLVAKGLPEEMMKLATQKTHEIRQAYDTIRAARGF
jgi:DnaJ like chaperone protein